MSGKPNAIQPSTNITLDISNDRIRNTLDAWLKFGTVFLVYRLCTYFFFDRENPNATFFDKQSLKFVIFILLGFAVYYLFVQPYIPINAQHPILRNLGNDMLMFGTVLVTSHLFEVIINKEQFFNKNWLKTAGIVLLSFATYDIIVSPFIPYTNMKPNVAPLVYDWAKYGTFLIMFRVLRGKSLLDQQWILSVLFVLLGFTGYQLVTRKLIRNN